MRTVLDNIEQRYDRTVEAIARFIKAENEIEYYCQGLLGEYSNIKDMLNKLHNKDSNEYYNNVVNEFRRECWHNVLNHTKLYNFLS